MSVADQLVTGETYALEVRRERGPTQHYTGRFLGASHGGYVFALAGGARLRVDEWSLVGAELTTAVPA